MQRLTSLAASFAFLFATASAAAEPRSAAIAALPEAAPAASAASQASPASTGEPERLSRADAMERLQREGFKTVTRLVRDSEGNWIGAARRGNRVVDVAVDQDGDVIAW
ncbi:MAG: hypothetical protein JNM30_07625 [Rhodospirillales bacterium]|nr:hypothetical protein [Rhodospirillales bacterium]